ncbi:protein FAR1-RELATED SEQUENCE 5-like [Chenopodium quinoa]|uniref:protein FAR1-RELATED SEQUENCE 5-like n=1 Tax=Chenopodium quinoa TaxID=63459 RepID=UPI000B78CA11|nr:protein FAR1-RELATED SEQUENCE 5-like [Chenopodium quinoa]
MTEIKGQAIEAMQESGLRPMESFNYMSNEAGGEDSIGHTVKDHMNYCYKLKIKVIEGGDSQVVCDKLQEAYSEDPNFFFREGINNHWKNTMFACSFIGDETIESFVWLFETFKKAMGGKCPVSLFTDQDVAMAAAIPKLFPNTRHRLCLWHLIQNAVTRFGVLKSDDTFKAAFTKCLSGCINEAQFEKSESTNHAVGFKANKKTSLTEFYSIFQKTVKTWRRNEDFYEFNSKKSIPTSSYPMSTLLKHAAEVYTHTLFRDFEEEFNLAIESQTKLLLINGGKMVYQVYLKGRDGTTQAVTYDPANQTIQCPCKNFEESGWLCFHTFRILHMHSVEKIPE